MLKYKIENRNTTLDLDRIGIEEVFESSKFVAFFYIIPRPFFPAVKRMSKVLMLPRSQSTKNLGRIYSVYNALICWFGMPFGPMNMLSCNKINRLGLEISNEIKGKITISDIQRGFFQLPLYTGKFSEISKSVRTEFLKIIESANPKGLELEAVLGYVKNSGKHYFYMGIKSKEEYQSISSKIEDLFKDKFDSRALLEVVDISLDGELQSCLHKNGDKL